MTQTSPTVPIVFVHGLFMNPLCWQDWTIWFQQKGYRCHAPAYPWHEGEPAQLRASIAPELGTLDFAAVMQSLREFIQKLPERPILIGHSMGGLAVQCLINEGLGSAGVCIDSAPPQGLFYFSWSFLKANLPVVNPFKGNGVFQPGLPWFHYAFCHTMSERQTQEAFDRWVVPESRNIPRSTMGKAARLDFSKPHAPLLFIAGEKDTIVPAALNRKNAAAYRDPKSKTDFRIFEGKTHLICAQPGWQEVAQFVEEWLGHQVAGPGA